MPRVILVHLNPLSARLHFWVAQLDTGLTACLFNGIPSLSMVHQQAPPAAVHVHPAAYLADLSTWLGCDADALQLVEPQMAWVEMPGSWVPVSLVRVMTQDLPQFVQPGRFISLMDIMEIPQQERVLFRYAYEALLGD